MFSVSLPGRAAAFGLLLAAAAHAQPVPVRPDPLDPQAAVPPATHRSALAAYRPAHEVKLGSWKDANSTVNRIGGWRAYAREASAAEPAPASVPAAPASAASRPMHSHGQGGKPAGPGSHGQH